MKYKNEKNDLAIQRTYLEYLFETTKRTMRESSRLATVVLNFWLEFVLFLPKGRAVIPTSPLPCYVPVHMITNCS